MTNSDAVKLAECAARDLAGLRGALERLEKENWNLQREITELRNRMHFEGMGWEEAYEALVEKVLDVDRGVATFAEAVALARGD